MDKDPGKVGAINFFHVDKVYPPNQSALTDADFRVAAGEFVFIAGASGAGKSTLLKLMFAEEVATRGTVTVLGKTITAIGTEERAALRRKIGVIFQDYKLLSTRNVVDNVAFSLEVMGVERRARIEIALKFLDAVGLKNRANAFPRMLSGGEQQRIAVARALVGRPKLILADEPTGNLDPDMTLAVFNLLLEANSCGATVVIASHNLQLIEELNKRTIVLDRGRIIGDFSKPGG